MPDIELMRIIKFSKRFLVIILTFTIIACEDKITTSNDYKVKREIIPFKNALPWIQRNAPQSKDLLFYIINSTYELDTLSLKFMNSEFLKNKFSGYDFVDSTLIGLTYPRVFSSSANVFIDSLVLCNDSIHVHYHLRHLRVNADVTSLSDVVSIGKRNNPLVWIPGDTVYE